MSKGSPRVRRRWTSDIADVELAILDVCVRATGALPIEAQRRIVEFLTRRVAQSEYEAALVKCGTPRPTDSPTSQP